MSKDHRYKLSYRIAPYPAGGITRQEAFERNKAGEGSCDAALVASMIYPADGSLSILFVGMDGRSGGGVLDDNEWFKVFAMLSSRLARSATLETAKREFCEAVWSALTSDSAPPRPSAEA